MFVSSSFPEPRSPESVDLRMAFFAFLMRFWRIAQHSRGNRLPWSDCLKVDASTKIKIGLVCDVGHREIADVRIPNVMTDGLFSRHRGHRWFVLLS